MMDYLVYEAKVAVGLLVFYLFYRFLLKKETFHRLNRAVLVGTVVLSFALPLCIITIHRPAPESGQILATAAGIAPEAAPVAEKAAPWWPTALYALFWAGAAFVLLRVVISILSIVRIVRQGELVHQEDGCKVVVTGRDIDPFSWMRYIVLSRKDWEGDHTSILAHEKAHIAYGPSAELLLVDVLSALQWFNPAVWMLRSDLQELHEYEADDAVLRAGTPIKDYQYLLIRKAVGKSGYSVANSFNHSILKKRITMMSKTKSPLRRGLRVLLLLPLVCLGIGLQARTVFVPVDKGNEIIGDSFTVSQDQGGPLFILRQWDQEKEITKAEFDKIERHRISSIEILKDEVAKDKYGDRGANGVIVVTLKRPQELEEIVVVRYGDEEDEDKPIPFVLANPDKMPQFQGGDMNTFSRWLNQRIVAPKNCKHSGTMKIRFMVGSDGTVSDVQIAESICAELDSMMLELVSKSPKWEPAVDRGKPVAQFITIPVVFQMR